jgi:hypothetical protein
MSPQKMLASDATAKAMLKKYTLPMPDQGLSEDDARQLIRYFHWFDEQGKSAPAGSARRP